MAYIITRSDSSSPPITVPDDNTGSSPPLTIDLIGRNKTNYGLPVATTQVHILENFAFDVAPSNPIPGQIWFDNTEGAETLKINTGIADGTPNEIWTSLLSDDHTGDVKITGNLEVTGEITGTASSARYSDLAERYHADDIYEPGTVIKIGGPNEITQTLSSFDPHVFGVISTDPAYLMNAKAGENDTHPPVALAGRVPIKVVGSVTKGDRLVSSSRPGVAMSFDDVHSKVLSVFNIIGRALESSNDDSVKLIEAVVGAK